MLKAIVTFIYKEIDMVTNNEIGELEIINLPRLHPFVVKFENFEEANAIQVDVAGIGAFRYFAPISDDILLQIHTNINKKLRIYGKKSGHNPENIGYNLNFNPIKDKYSNKTPMIGVDIAIFSKNQ
jgi:hypothetical protein